MIWIYFLWFEFQIPEKLREENKKIGTEKQEIIKGQEHLKKGLESDFEYRIVLEELFEKVYKLSLVQKIISEYK